MAKKATGKGGGSRSSGTKKISNSRVLAKASGGPKSRSGSEDGMGDAFIKLLQSPLVADLLAVAATAALAALAEHGFNSRGADGAGGGKRAGKAAKEAGKAAVAAMGRRLGTEMEEIRAASKKAQAGAGA